LGKYLGAMGVLRRLGIMMLVVVVVIQEKLMERHQLSEMG